MSEIVRLYSYKDLFAGRRAVGRAEIMAKLEISEATFKRDIAKLRDQLHMPIAFDRDLGGFTMAPGHDDTTEVFTQSYVAAVNLHEAKECQGRILPV